MYGFIFLRFKLHRKCKNKNRNLQKKMSTLSTYLIKALSFNCRGGGCPPKYINRFICGRIRAGKPCPYRYIHPFSILNEAVTLAE